MVHREIGSDFYLPGSRIDDFFLSVPALPKIERLVQDKRYLSSGRQAIRFCLRDMDLEEKRALLPEFTCHSVIQPFLEEGFSLSFYPVDGDFQVPVSHLNRLAKDAGATVLLFHPYFGFNTVLEDEAFDKGIFTIYDATQSFLSSFPGPPSDYIMASIRKWGPFPDGAFCGKVKGLFCDHSDFPQDLEFLKVMSEAQESKARYLEEGVGDKGRYRELYGQAHALLGSRQNFYRMGEPSLLLYRTLNFNALAERRKHNYLALLAYPSWHFLGQPLFPGLKDQVPLYFPFLVGRDKRSSLQAFLAERDIYAPVIWPRPAYQKEELLNPISRKNYREILALPIDQRYGPEDMDRIQEALDAFVEGAF